MSIESELNASETAERAPTEYKPLPTAQDLNPPEKPKEYDDSLESVHEAARDLSKAREEGRVPQAEAETVRDYHWQNGQGKKVAAEYEVDAKRAADDLTRVREQEVAAANQDLNAQQVDAIRQGYQEAQQPAQPEAQPQPEAQATAEQQSPDDAVVEEVRRVLEANPRVRQALESELQVTEQHRQAYVSATRTAAQLSAAAMFSQWPELTSLSEAQLPIALQMIQKQDPAKAAAIETAFQKTKGLWQAAKAAEQQHVATQQKVQDQQTKAWMAQQDKAYDAAVKDTPEQRAKLGEEAIAMLKEYGATDSEIAAAWSTPGPFRSAVGQRILRDAAAHRLAQRGVAEKISKPVPLVQKPGVSRPQDNSEDVSAAMRRFNANPTPRNAAEILLARRAAKR
jgi:hypothetical protein